MKLKEELREVEVPHTLSLKNNTAVDVEDITVANSEDALSPETLSHRLHQGWQQLQEYSETLLNNNNNLTCNDNSKSDVVTSAAVDPYLVDGNFRPMSSDESGSSSEDESSVSYSDTSPLLEVSSYDSDVSLYSDMSEDGSLLENSVNNNNDDEEEEEEGEGNLLEASRMSLSSPSLDESSDCSSASSSSKGSARNKVILPDVLPVGRVSNHNEEDDDDLMSDASLSDAEVKDHGVDKFRVQNECSVVQITAQPDIQADVRMNSPKSPLKESAMENKNTYQKIATDGHKKLLQKRNLYTWSVDEKYDVYNTANKTSVRHWEAKEPDGLVDDFKVLTVKDAGKIKENPHPLPELLSNETIENGKLQTKAVQANIPKRRKNSISPLPETVCLFGKENQRYRTTQAGLPSKEECTVHSSKTYAQKSPGIQKRSPASPLSCQKENRDNNSNQCSSNKAPVSHITVSNNVSSGRGTLTKNSSKDKTITSPELFDVYTIEAEASHINWADLRKSDPESEWIRKRRNDREEIRRKLAMDSDTEEFLPEKVNKNSESKPSGRIKDNSNLQICFVNETVTDDDSPKSCDTKVREHAKMCDLLSVPQVVPSQANSPNAAKSKSSSRTQSSISAQSSVTKRQRPNFFFNRPRSMILQKTDQKAGVEDLVSRHIRLQAEAREALAQAKDMARMQMEIEKQQKKKSPIAEIVGLPFPDGKTYLTHNTLKDMNVAQLQVIVNDLHSQIESLNEDLVKFLLERDDLHMEQDSMLVDIEDLTKYLGLKGSNCVSHPTHSQPSVKLYGASNEKVLKTEPVVKRSHSVQLRKSKNLM